MIGVLVVLLVLPVTGGRKKRGKQRPVAKARRKPAIDEALGHKLSWLYNPNIKVTSSSRRGCAHCGVLLPKKVKALYCSTCSDRHKK